MSSKLKLGRDELKKERGRTKSIYRKGSQREGLRKGVTGEGGSGGLLYRLRPGEIGCLIKDPHDPENGGWAALRSHG